MAENEVQMHLPAKLRPQRRGTSAIEFAVVGGITFFLIFALVIGGMGIFRYQEVAHLAREGSRYASTHGGQYHLDGIDTKTGVPAISTSADLQTYLQTLVAGLDPNYLTVTVSYSAPANYMPRNMPSYDDTDPTLVPPGQITISNYVTVTVSYQWTPELFLVGPITLTSTSTLAMCY
jgi:Flp pilus assembly protein TadG